MKIQVKKTVSDGEMIPRGYGIAYRDFLGYQKVCYPVPLNWVVRFGRAVARRLKIPPMTKWEQETAKLVQRYYERGKQAGYLQATRMIDERIAHQLKEQFGEKAEKT